jgi:hypothetical protein
MLAAHRCGGRTDFRSFARAWDGFTGAGRRARRASERELRTLTAQLEASLWEEDESRAEILRTAPPATRAVPADGSGRPAVRHRERVWLGPFRRWDRYRDAVRHALGRAETAAAESELEPEPEPERERV